MTKFNTSALVRSVALAPEKIVCVDKKISRRRSSLDTMIVGVYSRHAFEINLPFLNHVDSSASRSSDGIAPPSLHLMLHHEFYQHLDLDLRLPKAPHNTRPRKGIKRRENRYLPDSPNSCHITWPTAVPLSMANRILGHQESTRSSLVPVAEGVLVRS